MEDCFALLPRRCYNKFGFLCLAAFVSAGVVLIGIASDLDSKATLQCNPDKTLASDVSTRKFIETQCLLKYAKEFLPLLPLHYQLMINFGLVLFLCLIYAYWVKDRVEIFVETPSATTNNVEDERPLLSSISPAASDPKAYRQFNRFPVFTIYILHLFFFRIIPLVVFATLLLTLSYYPVKYDCPWPVKTTTLPLDKFLGRPSINRSLSVDCIYPMGSKMETLAVAVVTTNFLTSTVAFIELVFLLWSSWKDDNLLTDLEFCCVYILRKRKRIRKLIRKIRESISDDKFELHDDFGGKRLSRRKLEDIYINVIILEGREIYCTSRKKFQNRHETYEAHFKLPPDSVTIPRAQELFKPISGHQPRTVLVVGRPGIGKTLLTKKLLHEWKQEKFELWRDEMVMVIRFREFNRTKGRTSLREMLQRHAFGFNMSCIGGNHIHEYISCIPRKAVLIFDGLDELKVDDETLVEEIAIKSHSEVAHVLQIYRQLLKGELLPGITVLTTTRPTAKHIYQKLKFDREVELIGFHQKQIKDYVEKFCHPDKQKSSEIWDLIKQSPELLGLCYIPVNSYIVCLTLKESIQDEGQTNAPRTITELYKRAINILLFKHHRKYKNKPVPNDYIIRKLDEPLQNDLNKLKEIARQGMIENKLIFQFDDEDDNTQLADSGLFNKLEDKRQNIFCFLHLTIQEFLAAQHVVDDMNNIESFLCDHISNPQWHLVIQFVCGLIGDKIRELETKRNKVERSTEYINTEERPQPSENTMIIMDSICKRFQDWMPKSATIKNENDLLVIKCVHEMQVIHVMKEFAASSECKENVEVFYLDHLNIAPAVSTALFQFLSFIKNLHKLNIYACTMELLGTRQLAKLLAKNANCQLTELDMRYNNLTDESWRCFCDALKSKNCKLTKLDISLDNLTDENVECLSDALKSKNCKLTELDISGNELTDESGRCLSDALKSKNCKLTKLDISGNNLTDESGRCLSDALKSKNCKLTELDTSNNKLTDENGRCLSDALENENCKLTKLYIRHNNLTDESGRCLSDALKSENCKLTELDISDNKLTDESARCLSDALKSKNCKLTVLDIRDNKLTDESVRCLSDALKSENCKLTKLYISCNKLTDESARCLSDALKSKNCKLTELDISYNKLTDESARCVSDALKSENCKLTKLYISVNKLTDESGRCLSDALKNENCKLTEINISGNKLTDESGRCLSDALKSENCKLTELDISHNKLTDESVRCLSDALNSKNCKLNKLYISDNELTDESARCLSDALKSENCKLTALNMSHNKLTDESARCN